MTPTQWDVLSDDQKAKIYSTRDVKVPDEPVVTCLEHDAELPRDRSGDPLPEDDDEEVPEVILKARAFLVEPPCHICGRPATHVELRRESDGWRFIYEGIEAGNGNGDIVSDEKAAMLTATFADPPHFDLMREADLHYDNAGYCEQCGVAYCYTHWNPTTTGWGTCPQGHGKGLDPHWSPDFEDAGGRSVQAAAQEASYKAFCQAELAKARGMQYFTFFDGAGNPRMLVRLARPGVREYMTPDQKDWYPLANLACDASGDNFSYEEAAKITETWGTSVTGDYSSWD
jgi:hypothetical protein